ncbi:DUF5134 domain-containing protein [Pseudonocardia sp. HH130630-07]|uniref:DUF5134 domain-containing protein n=1 Tax=Pseudonocardia sp. HH130630-07 TaxID=1690815 RepID=UPI0008150522|nr:DUF5134 domain-containing protein [Pseudonocardia sp. HH130630-07]ANY07975.1 hypothetical protein AFB00_18605 [Pseudonocardia sp. HH130630-07]
MISSVPLAWALTALFALTGGYALRRWSEVVSAQGEAVRRTAELAHVVMSVAMVVMTWSWAGTAGVAVQIALFGVFTVFFAVTAARGVRCGAAGPATGVAHALMAAAMVWMLAAMPVIMPMAVAPSGGGGGHAGHGGGSGAEHAEHAAHGGQAGWAVAATVVIGLALLVVAGFWVARAVRRDAVPGSSGTGDGSGAPDPGGAPAARVLTGARPGGDPTGDTLRAGAPAPAATGTLDPGPAAGAGPVPGDPGTGDTAGPGGAAGPGGDTAAGDRTAPGPFGPRSDALCHATMSLGMVVMLAAMVVGW